MTEPTMFDPVYRTGRHRVDDWEPSSFAPSLPYKGTSGWSGTDTSHQRATNSDTSGKTSANQQLVLNLLIQAEESGLTWKEISDQTGMHHGTTSGLLSNLHKDSRIARLTMSRDKSRIYVHPLFIEGREHDTQGRRHECPNCGHVST